MGQVVDVISSFTGDYSFLSNFYPVEVLLDGVVYPSVEHAYQAAKTDDFALRRLLAGAKNPGTAKRMGRALYLVPYWEEIKVNVMQGLLHQKFGTQPFGSWLAETGTALLIEGNTWGDRFWGCTEEQGLWVGQNMLGTLLMEIRDGKA